MTLKSEAERTVKNIKREHRRDAKGIETEHTEALGIRAAERGR